MECQRLPEPNWSLPNLVVILSEVAASQREAATQSKDPYPRHDSADEIGRTTVLYAISITPHR